MHYYYFPDLVLKFLHEKPTSRAEDIMANLPGILAHYREEAQQEVMRVVFLDSWLRTFFR